MEVMTDRRTNRPTDGRAMLLFPDGRSRVFQADQHLAALPIKVALNTVKQVIR